MSYKTKVDQLEADLEELQRVVDEFLRGRTDPKRNEVVVADPAPALSSENWDG